jgi:hypothetical protein
VGREIGQRFQDAGQAMAALDRVLGGTTAPHGTPHLGASQAPAAAAWPAPAYQPAGIAPYVSTGGARSDIGGVGHTLPTAVPVPSRGAPVGVIVAIVGGLLVLAGLGIGGVFLLAHLRGGASGAGGRDLSGSYAITHSQNIAGGSYQGTVLCAKSGEAYRVGWTLAKGPGYEGLALVMDRTLAVGWANGGRYGVAAYKIDGGKLHGRWTSTDAPSVVGVEELSGPENLNGTYTIVRSSSGYTGTVAIVPTGETYSVTWAVSGGGFRGVGIKRGDVLSVGWSPGATVGVVSYDIARDTLVGRWSLLNETRVGTETLTKR